MSDTVTGRAIRAPPAPRQALAIRTATNGSNHDLQPRIELIRGLARPSQPTSAV
jgi:hypothetical protein